MALKFTVHTDGMDAVKEALARGCSRAEHVLAVQVMKDTAPFVPMRNGSLRARTRVDGNLIIYEGPYARYLYYGKLYVDPLTGSPLRTKGRDEDTRHAGEGFEVLAPGHALALVRGIQGAEPSKMAARGRQGGEA